MDPSRGTAPPPPPSAKEKRSNEMTNVLQTFQTHMTPQVDEAVGFALAGLVGVMAGYALHRWGGVGQPSRSNNLTRGGIDPISGLPIPFQTPNTSDVLNESNGMNVTVMTTTAPVAVITTTSTIPHLNQSTTSQDQSPVSLVRVGSHVELPKSGKPSSLNPSTSALPMTPVAALASNASVVDAVAATQSLPIGPVPLVPVMPASTFHLASSGGSVSYAAPSTCSVRTAMSRLLEPDDNPLEGLPQYETLLELFARLSYYARLPEQSDLSREAHSSFRSALYEADALCLINLQRSRANVLPSVQHAQKAHKHLTLCVASMLDLKEAWETYEQPQIQARLLRRKARLKLRAERIRIAAEQGADEDEAARDSEEEEVICNDSDSDLFCDPRQLKDPRRQRVFNEYAPLIQPNMRENEQRAAIRRVCKDRLRYQIVDGELKKIQAFLQEVYQEIKDWYVMSMCNAHMCVLSLIKIS